METHTGCFAQFAQRNALAVTSMGSRRRRVRDYGFAIRLMESKHTRLPNFLIALKSISRDTECMNTTAASSLPMRLTSIQALRGIAAFLVMLFHIAGTQEAAERAAGASLEALAPWRNIFELWTSGVDLFFVISGFIMVYITRDYVASAGQNLKFLWSRLARIYPLWWFFASIMAAYFVITYGSLAAPDRISEGSRGLGYYLTSLSLLPSDQLYVIGVGWTLTHELWFYLVFTALLCAPRKFLPLGLMLWALILGAAAFAAVHTAQATDAASLVFSVLGLEFIAGALAAWAITKWPPKAPKAFTFGALAVLAILYAANLMNVSVGSVNRVLLYALPYTALVYGVTGLEITGRLKFSGLLVTLGNWSYSLYLCHLIVILAVARIFAMIAPHMPAPLKSALTLASPGIADNIVHAIVCAVGSLVVAGISYRLIEKPTLKLSKRWSWRG